MYRKTGTSCTNCGKSGHSYKECKEPITSIGIIALRDNHILMIQRKDSFAYIDFLRGKYDLENTTYIQTLFENMSTDEVEDLRSGTSHYELWSALWSSAARPDPVAAAKFEEFMSNATLRSILDEAKGRATGPEWGFPKGRRQPGETELATAMREFEEEIGIPASKYVFISNVPIEETFVGTDGVTYRHKYYVARCDVVDIAVKTAMQKKEIGQIAWVPRVEAADRIRTGSTILTMLSML